MSHIPHCRRPLVYTEWLDTTIAASWQNALLKHTLFIVKEEKKIILYFFFFVLQTSCPLNSRIVCSSLAFHNKTFIYCICCGLICVHQPFAIHIHLRCSVSFGLFHACTLVHSNSYLCHDKRSFCHSMQML